MSEYDEVYKDLSKSIESLSNSIRYRRTLHTERDTIKIKKEAEKTLRYAKKLHTLLKQGKVWTSTDKEGLRFRVIDIEHYPGRFTRYDKDQAKKLKDK